MYSLKKALSVVIAAVFSASCVFYMNLTSFAQTDETVSLADNITISECVNYTNKMNGISEQTVPVVLDLPTITAIAGDGKIDLSWSSVSGATSYLVKYIDTNNNSSITKYTTNTSLTIKYLTNGTAYKIIVLASDDTNTSSYTDSDFIIVTPKAAIIDLVLPKFTATAGDGKIDLSWNVVENATSYKVICIDCETNTALIIPYQNTSYTIKPLTNDKAYKVIVLAVNGNNESKYTSEDYIQVTPSASFVSDLVNINSSTFPDAAFRQYVSDNFDTDNSSGLSQIEINAVKSIYINTNESNAITNIKSLKGIEHFKNLEVLYCLSNQITSLDISKNTLLTEVSCYGNSFSIGNISSTYDLNNLADFEPSKATNWRGAEYDLQTNSLKNFTSTEILYDYNCGNNFYFTFRLKADTIPADDIIEINVVNFPDPVFRQYVLDNCDTNKNGWLAQYEIDNVKCIDVSGTYSKPNTITDLTGIGYFTELWGLSCNYNNLTKLDLSNNTKLIILSCFNNQIECLEISKNTFLDSLNCSGNKLTSLDLSKNTALRLFEFSNNIYSIGDIADNYSLDNLPEGFIPANASNWTGAEYDISKNSLKKFTSKTVTYTYNCGNGKSASFTLKANSYIPIVSKPQNVKAVEGTNSITLSWNAAEGADKYTIYTVDNGEFTKKADTAALTYTLNDLVGGITYGFIVQAWAGEYYSDLDISDAVYATPNKPIHTHSPASTYSKDKTGHWYACSGCDEKVEFESHIEDIGTITTEPTETTEGVKTFKCTECGYIIRTEDIAKLNHSHRISDDYSKDKSGHWHTCSNCEEKIDYANHTEDSGTVTRSPTETSEGVKMFKCTECGYVIRTEAIPANTSTDPITAFVERLYLNILNRNSDPSKVTHIKNLQNGESACKVAFDFVFSSEFANLPISNEERVKRMYLTFLNREADPTGLADWTAVLDNGCSIGHIFYGFTQSNEFTEICDEYGITRGTWECTENRDRSSKLTAFVSRLYTKAMGRSYDVNGLNDHTGNYLENRDLYQLAYNFIFSSEFIGKNLSDEEFVDVMYRTFFDREADPAGKADWLGRMRSGCSREYVLAGFVGSQECAELVARFGI